ncbi:hypothetical protein ASE07_10365 [Noviherbaspirillum sp. Root189]|nr:hypothetical protein ASE07_10365 [Noviherbaspirillum sp. Root189]
MPPTAAFLWLFSNRRQVHKLISENVRRFQLVRQEWKKPSYTISRTRVLAWPVSCVMIGMVLWTVTVTRIEAERTSLNDAALQEAGSLAKAYSAQLARSVEQLDQITLNLQYFWETSSGLNLEEQVRRGLYAKSSQLRVTLFDPRGHLSQSTDLRVGNINIRNHDWFQQHMVGRVDGLHINKPEIALQSNAKVVRFTRSLADRDRAFAGVISVIVEPQYLASFTDQESLSRNDFIALYRNDGEMLASKSGKGTVEASSMFTTLPAFQGTSGTMPLSGSWFPDSEPRVVAWHAVEGYPLLSVVGLSEQAYLEPFRSMREDYLRFAFAASVFLIFTAVFGMAFTAGLAWRKKQAEELRKAYHLAIDGAREGFYMVRAIYDGRSNLIDFAVVDCNERGASLVGTTKDRLIGTRFSEIFTGNEAARAFAVFQNAMEAGFYEADLKVPPESPLKVSWVYQKLVRSGNGLAITVRDISETKEHEETLASVANSDELTSLPNRHWLMHYLPSAVEKAKAADSMLAVMFVDLDDFKIINDTLGHAAGDELLQAAAGRIRSVVRPTDHVVRLGGDEFTVILEQVASSDDVVRVADRIIATLHEPFLIAGGSSHVVYGSVGVSLFPDDGADARTLLKHADIAMYAAKGSGKRHYCFFEERLSERLLSRMKNEKALQQAITFDEFELYYQPRVDTYSGELRSMEALVRWRHPERGMVPPMDFIPIAEETGLIVGLGELVARKACRQLAAWQAAGLRVVPVSINVSPRQFSQGGLSALFASCLSETGLDSSLVEIEVTETCMMSEDSIVADELAAIESLGIKLLVDDFGTGYSSLAQLQRLDMDVLKIDKAFTAQLDDSKEGEALVMAVISMAHVLGMSVVAEGVETHQQLQVLQALSCNEVQGYLISRPVPAEDVPQILDRRFLFTSAASLRDEELVR